MRHKFCSATILGLGTMFTLLFSTNFALAQVGESENNGYQSNEQDAIYGDGIGGLDPIKLMHRAQQMNGRSAEEFNQDSQGQINNSASKFKQLQQQRILEQRQKPTQEPETAAE